MVLTKDTSEGLTQQFGFDILSKLVNIHARITLYRLFKSIRDAFREALADAGMFLTQVPSNIPGEEPKSLQIFVPSTRIMFNPEDMQLGKYDKSLYFTSYLGSTEVNRVLVDPGFTLSIKPRQIMQHLEILARWLNSTDTMINGFKANGACPLGKIMLNCQIGDLSSEVTYY